MTVPRDTPAYPYNGLLTSRGFSSGSSLSSSQSSTAFRPFLRPGCSARRASISRSKRLRGADLRCGGADTGRMSGDEGGAGSVDALDALSSSAASPLTDEEVVSLALSVSELTPTSSPFEWFSAERLAAVRPEGPTAAAGAEGVGGAAGLVEGVIAALERKTAGAAQSEVWEGQPDHPRSP